MKYLNVQYQCSVLNRLGNMAYRKGGIKQMNMSLDKAMQRIWDALENYYKGAKNVSI